MEWSHKNRNMKVVYTLLLIIYSIAQLYGQQALPIPLTFDNVLVKGSSITGGDLNAPKTCGIYTYGARVEEGYFKVDLYGRILDVESWQAVHGPGPPPTFKKFDLSNIVGSFGLAVEKALSDRNFLVVYEDFNVELSSTFSVDYGEHGVFSRISGAKQDIGGMSHSLSFTYRLNKEQGYTVAENIFLAFGSDIVDPKIPYYLGTIKMKIKSAEAEGSRSGFETLVASGSNLSVCDAGSGKNFGAISTNHIEVGWLDGKSPNIPLKPDSGPKVPADPIFATADATVCLDAIGQYSISAVPEATSYEWWVATDAAGINIVPGLSVTTTATPALNGSVDWKSITAGVYYVCVKAKNEAGVSGVANSEVTVVALPKVSLAAALNGTNLPNNSDVCGNSDVTLTAGGDPGLTYVWTGIGIPSGETKNPVQVTLANTISSESYTVTASTSSGCKKTAEISLNIKSAPVIGGFDPILADAYPNGKVILNLGLIVDRVSKPTTGYTYAWTINTEAEKNTPTIDVAIQGDMMLTAVVSKSYGELVCSDKKSHSIKAEGGITLELAKLYADTELCMNGVLPLKAKVTGMSPGTSYTYKWYKGTSSALGEILETVNTTESEHIYAASETGNYAVVVETNTGLKAVADIPVTENSKTAVPVVVEPVIIAATASKQVILLASPQKGSVGTFAFSWNPKNLIVSGDAEKQYPLTKPIVEDTPYQVLMKDKGQKCVSGGETTVKLIHTPIPDLSLSMNHIEVTLCQGNRLDLLASVLGTSSTVTYSWLPTKGLDDAAIGNPIFTASTAGVGKHRYIVTAKVDGITLTSFVDIEVLSSQAPTFARPDKIYCLESAMKITNPGSLSYQWTLTDAAGEVSTQTGTSILFPKVDTYTVKVVASNGGGCSSDTAVIQNVVIKQLQLAHSLDRTTYKLGENITSSLTASEGWGSHKYTWTSPLPNKENTNENTYTVVGASEDSYTFTASAKDLNGCVASADDKIATKIPGGLNIIKADTMYAYCNGGMAILQVKVDGGNTPYQYAWTLEEGDGTVLSENATYLIEDPALKPTAVYKVLITDASTPALERYATIAIADKKTNLSAPSLTTPGTITINSGDIAQLSASATPLHTETCLWNWTPTEWLGAGQVSKQFAKTTNLSEGRDFAVYMVDDKACISPKANLKVIIDKTGSQTTFDLFINASVAMCAQSKQILSATITPEQSGILTYSWISSPNLFGTTGISTETTPEINPTIAGTYTVAVTVTNAEGKKNTAIKTIEVTDNPLPQLVLDKTDKACEGDLITASVQGTPAITPGTYTWYVDGVIQDGVVENTLSLANTGLSKVVKVTAVGTNTCLAEAKTTLDINAKPILAWDPKLPTSVAIGTELTAIATATADKEVLAYEWSWVGTSPIGDGLNNTYKVTAQKNDTEVHLVVKATDKATTCVGELTGAVLVEQDALSFKIELEGDKACVGGSAYLAVRDVTGAIGPYFYEWTKGNDATIIGTDSILIVPVKSTVAEEYFVTVKNASDKRGESSKVITGVEGYTVPTVVACADISIPINTKAVLTADATGTGPYVWGWRSIANLDSPAEASLQSSTTKPLSKDTEYFVRVKDASGCISGEDNITVLINGSNALKVEIVPEMDLCINNKVRYRALVTKGGVAVDVISSDWKAGKGITEVLENQLLADYSAATAGNDVIVVVVSDGSVTATAKKEIVVKPYKVPNLQADNVSCAGDELTVSVVAITGDEQMNGQYKWFVSKDGGSFVATSNATGKYLFEDAGSYTVKVVGNTFNCTMDTLIKEIEIAPIPTITDIKVEETCGKAKVVATTQNADAWEWVDGGVFVGGSGDGDGNIRYYETTKMSQDFSGTLIAKNATAKCSSTSQSFAGTVYSLPAISLDPATTNTTPKSVYPNVELDIIASFTPALDYLVAWKQDGEDMQLSSRTIKTPALAIKSEMYKFAIEVTNLANNTCKTSDTVYVAVDEKNMVIDFGVDTMDVCQEVSADFYAKVENDKYGELTYKLTSNYPSFAASTTTGKFHYPFKEVGTFEVYVEVKNGNTPPDIRKDTVVVRVNPTPTLTIVAPDLGGTYYLCEHRGEIEVLINTTGTGNIDLYYSLAGINKTDVITGSPQTIVLTEGGAFSADSIRDSKGCKAIYERTGFEIKDDIPRLDLASLDKITKCQGGTTDLGITISNAKEGVGGDYPIELFYYEEVGKRQFTFADAATTFSSTFNGKYYLDSIRSNRGCIFKIDKEIITGEFTETTPILELTDKADKEVCGAGSLDIPFKITGGKPSYTLSYSIIDVSTEDLIIEAEGTNKITINGSGRFVVTGFTDANGCGDFLLTDTIDIKTFTPDVFIDSNDFAAYKDVNFMLGVKNANTAEYVYEWKENQAAFSAPNQTDGIKYESKLTASSGDIQFVLKGSSKLIEACFGTDTVMVYKIPDVPGIEIDTAKTRQDLKLTFTSLTAADQVDGYKIMSNLWDGYGIASDYTVEKASFKAGVPYMLAEKALDTLEFFYANAYRTVSIEGKDETFYSKSSDTVGYYKYDIHVNKVDASGNPRSSYQYFPVFFDLAEMGLPTSAEFLKTLSNLSYVYYFGYATQGWTGAFLTPVGKPMRTFDIKSGTLLRLLPKLGSVDATFLQYGKLPSRLSFEFSNENELLLKSSNSYGFMLPHRVDLKTSGEFLKEQRKIYYLSRWKFDTQSWMGAFLTPVGNPMRTFYLELLMPLQISPVKGTVGSIIWK